MTYEGPSWLGIGAQRCGTTWFTDLLVQHPQMDVAGGIKEHHALYKYGLTSDWTPALRASYRDTFTSDEPKLGEFTPYYLRASWVCELTADALPEDSPILVLLRDPIDRFASALRHEIALTRRRYLRRVKAIVTWNKRANDSWFARVLPKRPSTARRDITWLRFVGSDATWGGMYAAQLDAWTAVLPEERFIVIQYEKMRQDPQRYTDLVWNRLGLEPIPLSRIETRSKSSTETEHWLPEDHPHVVRSLQRVYRPDAERLATRFDIDLALWKRTMTDA
ncbi:MAG: sulfotransferase domain-containing protein [Actinomycetota bacterium]